MAGTARKRVTILGSTGSVGCSTVDLVLSAPEAYEVVALTAGRNLAKLAEQVRALRPRFVAVADPALHAEARGALTGLGVELGCGPEAVIAAAAMDAEWVMAGIVGAAGLEPTMAAVSRGAAVAFANKECLVSAGALMIAEVARRGATLLPADSEHNAIFQVFDPARRDAVDRIVLTASGGPFRTCSLAEMAAKLPEQALAHPTWSMGAKISVDSATMMNKGLEVIEAHHLFGLEERRIEVLVHPQSVVHGLVHYRDGSVLAQLGTPDMRTPIANVLAWPERMVAPVAPLDLGAIGALTFEPPDEARFPALRLARDALRAGGGAGPVLNAANEVAVAAFLGRRIGFTQIAAVVEDMLERIVVPTPATIAEVVALDREVRRRTRDHISTGLKRRKPAASALAAAAGC